MKKLKAFFVRWWARARGREADGHAYELALGQRVSIVTDFGRDGAILDRRLSEYGTEEYLIKRDRFGGASEWFPRFVLTTDAEAEPASSEITVTVQGEAPPTGTII